MNNSGNMRWDMGDKLQNLCRLFKLHVAYSTLSIACILCFSGCSTEQPNLSDAHMKAIELNLKAALAFANGDNKRAIDLYGDALKVSSSIEYTDGIAINLISLSAVYRKMNDRENARKCVDDILNSRHIPFDTSHLADAAFIKAVLYTDEGKHPSALEWADKALNFCNSGGCTGEGKIYNLKAKIALINNTPDTALSFAMQGLAGNRKLEDRAEEANSLRLLADVRAVTGQYDLAKKLYGEALVIDKSLGLEKKIATDLMGSGNVLCKEGHHEDALGYFKRAQSISKSSGDDKGIALAEEMLKKCTSSQ